MWLGQCEKSKGPKKDLNETILVNFSWLIHTLERFPDDLFVCLSQVKHEFYVQDPKNLNSQQVVNMKPKGTFNMGKSEEDDEDEDEDYR